MDWTATIDGYCERLDPGFWAEPLNAVSNIAFLIAAYVMWRRSRADGFPIVTLLIAILTSIGIGSFLFHTFATRWAALADVLPIALFILIYLYAANRYFWGLGSALSAIGTAAFIPYAALTVPVFQALPFFAISAAYWPVPVLILAYAAALARSAPQTALGLAIGGSLLCLSLVLRSLDEPLCETIPVGTHIWWHVLNGILLGWMIEVLLRTRLAARGDSG
ncbi:ceramidase domain-containing protein [Ovoidimarina sediminis]|uniref:ceramidase domain-containing protein n=1 Tax=Ovoidimarina sediminis TaxID=3079856 RepID=UPI002906B2AE|nr:ceramidase domain-containing protein [Rhodophyticola sp. MJ-SS7]MDU8945383.1 ceramidase domain-containing protein [Rhodophyticola sp. MJ-SS7]